jgi:hypothetical protein
VTYFCLLLQSYVFTTKDTKLLATDAQILQKAQSLTADYFVCSLRSGRRFFLPKKAQKILTAMSAKIRKV